MRLQLIACLLLATASGCSNRDSKFDDFDVVENLTDAEHIYDDSDTPIGMISHMAIRNDVLVAKCVNSDYEYLLIDTRNDNSVTHWGTTGRGPNEYLSFGMFVNMTDSTLVFHSHETKEMYHQRLADILGHKTASPVSVNKIPYQADFRPRNIYLLANGTKVANGSLDGCSVGIIDEDGNAIKTEAQYPFECTEMPDLHKGMVFQNLIAPNPQDGSFVQAFLCSDFFVIYKSKGNTLEKTYANEGHNAPGFINASGRFVLDTKKSIIGINGVSTTKNTICMMYSDAQMKGGEVQRDCILCFDWNGNKVKKLTLPFAVNTFCASDKYLYCSTSEDDLTYIYRFRVDL